MERVHVLIDRLAEQKRSGEGAAQLLVTVQLLQHELVLLQRQPAHAGSKKVAVVLPAPAVHFVKEEAEKKPAETTAQKAGEARKEEPVLQQEPLNESATPLQNYYLRRPSVTELLQEAGNGKEPIQKPQPAPAQPHFDVVEETPTLLQHTPQEEKKIHREVAQIIHGQQRSLNDQLKQQRTEVAHLLQDTPIKDLRKAIGINDKFVFLAELFNGDEAMYERSVKTINNFHVLQEAEYWMNRELKLRLGWNDTSHTVQHFYGLVRRRFS